VILVPWPTVFKGNISSSIWGCVCLCSIAGMAQTVHWDITISIWSGHLMIGLCPAQMAVASYICHCQTGHCIGVDFRTGPTEDGFPSRSVGSHLQAEGSNCDLVPRPTRSRAIFLRQFGSEFAFVVLQEWHRLCIGIFSISVWSDHLIIGLRLPDGSCNCTSVTCQTGTCIGVGFSNRADGGWFPITFPWVPSTGRGFEP